MAKLDGSTKLFIIYLVSVSLAVVFFAYSIMHTPPLQYTLVNYWSENDTCTVLVRPSRSSWYVRYVHTYIAAISDEGILLLRYNATVEGMGYLYVANKPCPSWLQHATIHPAEDP